MVQKDFLSSGDYCKHNIHFLIDSNCSTSPLTLILESTILSILLKTLLKLIALNISSAPALLSGLF